MITIDEIIERDFLKEIRTFDFKDDEDWDSSIEKNNLTIPSVVSECNRNYMLKYFRMIESCKSILEIGVNDYPGCLSRVLIDNKKDEAKYLGVDINPIPFTDVSKNQFGIQTDSADYEIIMSFAESKNISNFDFIFIDGWHSVNQILKEWRFIEHLNPNGIVAIHDTNYHPGPKKLIENLNPDKFIIEKYCAGLDDYGIAFVRRK